MNRPDSAYARIEQGIAALPDCLRPEVARLWQEFRERAFPAHAPPPLEADPVLATLPAVWACSDFVARTCLLAPELWAELSRGGALTRPRAENALKTDIAAAVAGVHDEAQLKSLLRRLRRRELLYIAWRDLAGWADLAEVMRTLSELADACLAAALAAAHAAAMARYGTPRGAQTGGAVPLVVLALGKLGGGELNFSSDIDLMFAYSEDGETEQGASNHEFFLYLCRRLIALLNDRTADGIVFRVDLRLRPNGDSGPLALSFDAMEQYYQLHGREWERYALIKARVAAGDASAGAELLARLKPFVYRRYLDYGAIAAIRELKETINKEVTRKGMQEHVKLGAGGIREIEFIAQAFQLIRGGREPALQERALLKVLPLLAERGYLRPAVVEELQQAYVFLRRTEHRLQMVADQQTHTLPEADCERQRLAFGMGFSDWPAFSAQLQRHRRQVHAHFTQVFTEAVGEETPGRVQGLAAVWLQTLDEAAAEQTLRTAGFPDPAAARRLLEGLRNGAAYQALSSEGRARLDRLMPLLLEAAGPAPLAVLERLVQLIEAIGRRSAYFSLLSENPAALTQLVKLCGASDWIAQWLSQHPVLLDELLHPATLYTPPARPELERELAQRLAQLPPDDLEGAMNALREFRHAHVLRVAAAEIGPGLLPDEARARLSIIAEVVLVQSLKLAWDDLVKRYGRPTCRQAERVVCPGFAVIAYGKLGGLELSYASDLDMIFLYYEHGISEGATDGARSLPNETFFARLGQRLIHLLSARTAAGILYNVDMRLRPSGQSGPLVSSVEAFDTYQRSSAWVWEHQALVRARPVAGDAEVRRRFDHIRRQTLCRRRDPQALRAEVKAMRERMQAAQPPHDPAIFDLKHDRGGIVDIEFMVQYWVLHWAADYPQLTQYTDNIRLLTGLMQAGRLEAVRGEALIAAYRRYLSLEQQLRLMEHRPWVPLAQLGPEPAQIARIWDEVFEHEV